MVLVVVRIAWEYRALPRKGRHMLLYHRLAASCAITLVSAGIAAAPTPALAEGPLSVALQAVIPSGNGGGDFSGTTQLGLGLGYDFGPPIVVPVRATAQFDYNGGSNGDSSLSTYGFTVGARLTTPIYAGIGIGPYFTSFKQPVFGPALVGRTPILIFTGPSSVTTTSAGLGTKFTVGDRILSLPGGVSLALEASYQLLPTVAGSTDPSAARLGLRLHI
jgi:hypothetical protein